MIITRSPLRITLGGGGTDLPSYYQGHEGFLVAAAIDRYVYITLHPTFEDETIIKYSRMERVTDPARIEHPIIREAIDLVGLGGRHVEITSMADIPAGTGLGSSGSFTTALLKALHQFRGNLVHPRELAEQACEIELGRLKEPIGKQDQYIAAFGGLTCFRFGRDGAVEAWPLRLADETRDNLEDSLVLFFTGYARKAGGILKDQDERTRRDDAAMIENLHHVKALGLESARALEAGDLDGFGRLMHVHWLHKKRRSDAMSNPRIDQWYELAMANGATGGKLIGAGGGGFLLFHANDKLRLRHALRAAGLREVRFRFDVEGTKVLA